MTSDPSQSSPDLGSEISMAGRFRDMVERCHVEASLTSLILERLVEDAKALEGSEGTCT